MSTRDDASQSEPHEFTKLGMEWAVQMARDGNLRLAALPFEKGERPYDKPIRPWKITRLAWSSWWRERRNRG